MRAVLLFCITMLAAFGVPKTSSHYQLSFLEFDEDGHVNDPAQLTRVLDLIESQPRIALVAFIHGWKSDVHTKKKVTGFEQTLAAMDFQGTPVVGVYLAWPGVRTSIPLLKELTFWDRKHVAERLPAGDFNQTLETLLRRTRERNPTSPIVLIGHSFGANVLERAIASFYMPSISGASAGRMNAAADLVLLVNSAANATHTKQFIDALQDAKVEADAPMLLSLTSDGDRITRFMLPVGQLPGYMSGVRGKGTLYLRSAGNVRSLHSHEYQDGHLTPIPDSSNHSPYWISRVPREVLPDHTNIFGPQFQAFLNATVRKYGLDSASHKPPTVRWTHTAAQAR